jgi:hypothetical protein
MFADSLSAQLFCQTRKEAAPAAIPKKKCPQALQPRALV